MRKPRLAALFLACIPFLAVCFSVPLWDRIYPTVFGLPFNVFWLMCWMPLTSVCLWGVYRLHVSRGDEQLREDKEGKAE